MNTNGWVHTRGFRTTHDPAWVDPLLATPGRPASNAILAVCTWADGSGQYVAVGTDVNVVVIELSENRQVGYAACPVAGGFQQVGEQHGYLYLANDGAGVYRLSWPDLDGDGTPPDWQPFLSTSTEPALQSDAVTGLYAFAGAEIGGLPSTWLAVCERLHDEPLLHIAEIVDVTGGKVFRSAEWWRNVAPDAVGGYRERLYFRCGNFVAIKYDGTAAAGEGAGWLVDATVCGSVDDDFADETPTGWVFNDTYGSVVEQNERLELTCGADVQGGGGYLLCSRNARLAGDADLQFQIGVTWPETNEDFQAYAAVYAVVATTDREERLALRRARAQSAGVVTDKLTAWRNGEQLVGVDCAAETFWLRLARTTDPVQDSSHVSLQYRANEAEPWVELALLEGLPDGAMTVGLYLVNDCPVSLRADLTALRTDYAVGTAYCGLPRTPLTAVTATEPVAEVAGDTLLVGFAEGLWGCQTDQSDPGRSERWGMLRGAYAASGGEYNVLPGDDNHILAVACSSGARLRRESYGYDEIPGLGVVAVGTTAGLTLIALADDTRLAHYHTDSGQPLVHNTVRVLMPAIGWAYGTPDGAGWLTPDDAPPADTVLYLRECGPRALVGWEQPADDDYDFSKLYRARVDGGQFGPLDWRVLREDGWQGVGRIVAFRGHQAFLDRTIDEDGRFDYKVAHLDRAGHESVGAVGSAYFDEPVVTSVLINDGAVQTRQRGVEIRITADSGDDSGNMPDAVGFVKIFEPGHDEHLAPVQVYESAKLYRWVLSPGLAGVPVLKEIAVLPYSRGGRAGQPLSAYIELLDESAEPAETASPNETFVLAHSFRGDGATVTDGNGDPAYPPANVQDPRLGVKWRSLDFSESRLRLAFGSPTELRYLVVMAHNLHRFAEASGRFTLLLHYVALENGQNVAHEVDLSGLVGPAMIPVDLQNTSISELELRLSYEPTGPALVPTAFEIGRVIVAAEGEETIQPRYNFAADFTWGSREHGKLSATPSARYAANPTNVRVAQIRLDDYAPAQRRPLFNAFDRVGRHAPVLLLLQPDAMPTLDDPHFPGQAMLSRADNLALYGYFVGDQQRWQIQGLDWGTVTLEVEEAVE